MSSNPDPFARAIGIVFKLEGGLVDDPHDNGGVTNHGISATAYPSLTIAALTKDQAAAIYRRDYWDRCRCAELPWPLALALFDAAVNQGAATAVRLLQRSLGAAIDGVIGPATLEAVQSAAAEELLGRYLARRAKRYAEHPDWPHFGMGWMTRLFTIQRECLK